jgi:nucleotide-binding universal stress UspA family protein
MYKRILVPLDASDVDRAVLAHIKSLATLCHAQVILMHVVDGWAGRQFGAQAVSPEVTEDQKYLDRVQAELSAVGLQVDTYLAFGEPAKEIIRYAAECGCDLIAMSTHGHRWLGDLVFGKTATTVQHRVCVPVLLVRAKPADVQDLHNP